MDNVDEKILELESHLNELAKKLTDSDTTPDEYAKISAEYTSTKHQISSLKIKRFMDGV